MSRFERRTLIGAVAGGLAAVTFVLTSQTAWIVALGIAVGIAYALAMQPTRNAYVDNLMAASALGVPLWALINVIAAPALAGPTPIGGTELMRVQFPALVGWMLYGASLGLLVQAFTDATAILVGPELDPITPAAPRMTRIVILGGGFAGMKTAACLEEELLEDRSVSIQLVSDTNALLFTPMLAEVAGSSLDASHISPPLRSSLHRTEFIRGRALEIDLDGRLVKVSNPATSDGISEREIPYDHLVLALGAVSNYFGMSNIEKFAFDFKSLFDAIRIRNHIIEMFERADRAPEPSTRAALLTFVVAGGGFAGVELAGAINDFAHGILADYPRLNSTELRTVLVHARDRILPELSESLARYAQQKMESRGVEFRLNTRLTDAQADMVILGDHITIPAKTLIWTAGTTPNPLIKSLPIEKDKRGAALVDANFAVPGRPHVWALGDCAAVNDSKTGKACPPTAQFALREAAVLAKNIHAEIEGRPKQAFHFDSLGALCVVGHQTACAELTVPFARNRTLRFSGLLAWMMWRGIYLAKLPGLERKIRVLIDWNIELFFPRDIVQTIDLHGK